jgi:hypothetical protein
MSYVDIVICIGSLQILETWPPIYRGQERTVRDRLKASLVYRHVYFRYTPCLTDFTFEFIRRPTPPILSHSSRTFVELTLVNWRQPWGSNPRPRRVIQSDTWKGFHFVVALLLLFLVIVGFLKGSSTENLSKTETTSLFTCELAFVWCVQEILPKHN